MADISKIKLPDGTTYNINAAKVNNLTVQTAVPANAKFTDTTYSSKAAASGGTDVSLVTTGEKYTWNNKSNFSGSYNDLSNKPTIPTKTSQLTNDSGYTTNTGTVTQVKVGTTAYNPSSGVISLPAYPTVPTVNNGTLTIQKNGANVQTFTANQSSNATANITVPTKTSELTNDSGFKTTDTNTHRPIQMNGTEILGNNTTALNLKAGSNVSLSNSGGTVTINATDTNTNNAVTQTATNSGNAKYEVLFSNTADNTTRTEGARKSSKLLFTPDNGEFKVDGQLVTGFAAIGNGTEGYSTISSTGIFTPNIQSNEVHAQYLTCYNMGVENISSQITMTKSSGNWSLINVSAYRSGNVVDLAIHFKGNGSAVAPPTNGFVGTISFPSGCTPVNTLYLHSYYSSSVVLAVISGNAISVRPFVSSMTLQSSANMALVGTFICE